MDNYNFSPIGFISSCYKEKFGIPRQSGLVNNAPASVVLNDSFNEEAVRGLEKFSHLWISFVFHANDNKDEDKSWKPMVRPPRLGGNEKVGVFASRSPYRPNPLGLSAVKIDRIELPKSNDINKSIQIHLLGCDLLDDTPVLDIKPYIPYADNITNANGGFANNVPVSNQINVTFSKLARQQTDEASLRLDENIPLLIKSLLRFDPRPSYKAKKNDDKLYSMKLFDFDLKWQYCENGDINVIRLT